jgi:hypothetical protein
MTKQIVAFRNFAKAPKNVYSYYEAVTEWIHVQN